MELGNVKSTVVLASGSGCQNSVSIRVLLALGRNRKRVNIRRMDSRLEFEENIGSKVLAARSERSQSVLQVFFIAITKYSTVNPNVKVHRFSLKAIQPVS